MYEPIFYEINKYSLRKTWNLNLGKVFFKGKGKMENYYRKKSVFCIQNHIAIAVKITEKPMIFRKTRGAPCCPLAVHSEKVVNYSQLAASCAIS